MVLLAEFQIVIQQIGLFVIYMIMGVLLVKTKVLNERGIAGVSAVVIKLALPLLIFTNTLHGVTRTVLFQTWPLLVLAALLYGLLLALGTVAASLFHLQAPRRQVFEAVSLFGNVGFMGIPILTSLFPSRGMLYVAVFSIVDQLMLWTVGIKLTSGERFNWHKLISPATVGIALALLMILVGVQLPPYLDGALSKVGATATPLALIYLGAVFAGLQIRRYLKCRELYGLVLYKMLILPLLIFMALQFVPIPASMRFTLMVLTGMPAMSAIVMLAKHAGSDGDYAVGAVFVTTIAAIFTLPIICWIAVQWLLPLF